MRLLVETENARLAAKNRTDVQLMEFEELLEQEAKANHSDIEAITQLDFEFHLLVTIATDNLLYPLLINSFKPVYTNLSCQFFQDQSVVPVVFDYHQRLVEAVRTRDEQKAVDIMWKLLKHGEDRLREIISQ
jgi:DNA-binding FadR family transcriptional regulator